MTFLFIFNSIYHNFSEFLKLEFNPNLSYLLISSFLITCLSIFFNAIAWKFLLLDLKFNCANLKIIDVFICTNIYKYLPGGIWHLVNRFKIIKNELRLFESVLSIILEPYLMVCAGLLIMITGDYPYYLKIILFLPSLLLFPKIINLSHKFLLKIINGNNFLLQKLDFKLNQFKPSDKNYPLKSLFFELLFIITRFSGFWLCLNVFTIYDDISFISCISVFCIAWIIGLIVPSAPGGLGVFESTIMLLLSNKLATEIIITSLIYYRIISTFADLSMFILFSTKKRFFPLKKSI